MTTTTYVQPFSTDCTIVRWQLYGVRMSSAHLSPPAALSESLRIAAKPDHSSVSVQPIVGDRCYCNRAFGAQS